jgi:hypothetical protein
MKGFGGFAKAFEAAIDKTLGIDGDQAEAVIGISLCRPPSMRKPWEHGPRPQDTKEHARPAACLYL